MFEIRALVCLDGASESPAGLFFQINGAHPRTSGSIGLWEVLDLEFPFLRSSQVTVTLLVRDQTWRTTDIKHRSSLRVLHEYMNLFLKIFNPTR